MAEITDFHAHLYYDPSEVDRARAVAAAAQEKFGVPVGHSIWARSGRTRAAAAS